MAKPYSVSFIETLATEMKIQCRSRYNDFLLSAKIVMHYVNDYKNIIDPSKSHMRFARVHDIL